MFHSTVADADEVAREINSALQDTGGDSPTSVFLDTSSCFWARYKQRRSGDAAIETTAGSNHRDEAKSDGAMNFEQKIWVRTSKLIAEAINGFADWEVADLNDNRLAALSMHEITMSYGLNVAKDDLLLRNCIAIDLGCEVFAERCSAMVGEVGRCCVSDILRSRSFIEPIQDICSKRTDLGGTTDWVMRRYGGTRREASMYVNLMWTVTWFMFLTGGSFGAVAAVDASIALVSGWTTEQVSSNDGDRTTHRLEETELAPAVQSSAERALTNPTRVRAGVETVLAARTKISSRYPAMYGQMRSAEHTEKLTPEAYLMSRHVEGMYTSAMDSLLAAEYGASYDTMSASNMCCRDVGQAYHTGFFYNDLSDAVVDMKFKETHNYVLCAKVNNQYSFSDHCDALSVAMTTLDSPCGGKGCASDRLFGFRCGNAVYYALWPRYRACDRGRRYFSSLSVDARNELILRGRMCLQGEVHLHKCEWLDAVCSGYSHRRMFIQERGYAASLSCMLGMSGDQEKTDYIQRKVKAVGARPFDTGVELVESLGADWLSVHTLHSIRHSENHDNLVTELSSILDGISFSSMPLTSEHTVTPCETRCGEWSLRLVDLLTVVSAINEGAGAPVLRTVAAVITMVSLDPFRCIAHHADTLLAQSGL